MLVVVIGNYASDNLGDDMYLYMLRSKFPEHTFVAHTHLQSEPDRIVYGGGGVLHGRAGRHTLLNRWRKEFEVPYCVLSVGTSPETPTRPFPGASFITVRDEEARKRLLGSILLPDLAWSFEPLLQGNTGEFTGVMPRHSTTYNDKALKQACRRELRRLTDKPLLFFSTYGTRLLSHTLYPQVSRGFKHEYHPYATHHDPGVYVSRWFSRCKRVIAMPYHGVVFAAIHGAEWATWPYDNKVSWLCDDLGGTYSSDLSGDLTFNKTPMELVEKLRKETERHYELLDRFLTA